MNSEPEYLPEEEEQPFGEVLRELLQGPEVPIHLLYRFSDMSEAEQSQAFEQWLLTGDERRQEIARHLADISEDNYLVDFQPLFCYCLADPDPLVRTAALEGLWDATDLTLIEPIIALLHADTNAQVQAAAAAALSHYLLMSAWGELRGVPVEEISAALLTAYRSPESDVPLRRAALEALGSVPTAEVQGLIEAAYEGSVPELQLGALFAMGNSADERWLSILLDEMESPYSEMRAEAARASGQIGSSEAVPALTELAYDAEEEVAIAAIAALGLIGGENAQAVLNALLEDEQAEHLAEIVEAAIDEVDWLASELSLLDLLDDDADEDDLLDLDALDE